MSLTFWICLVFQYGIDEQIGEVVKMPHAFGVEPCRASKGSGDVGFGVIKWLIGHDVVKGLWHSPFKNSHLFTGKLVRPMTQSTLKAQNENYTDQAQRVIFEPRF